jgi:cyclopropane-fatty-acyl-phospholipid synthase
MAIIEFFLKRLIRRGHLQIIEADGVVTNIVGSEPGPYVSVQFHDKGLLLKLAQDFTLHLGEAYMDGRLTMKEGSLYDLLELFALNYHDAPPMPWEVTAEAFAPLLRSIQGNSLSASRKNVAHHYDISANFFKLFLDSDLQYSCGYFIDPENDLETAQFDKKRLIASKLLLKPGMHVLDIGCGFGGLALYLAKTYGVVVTGITLSAEQHQIAVERVQQAGLADLVEIRISDYREETETYDRIVSIGMFEHVGVAHYGEFFKQIKALLKDDGSALLHSIGRMDGPGASDSWMVKYIFPGGYAPALSEVLPIVEKSGLWSSDIEILRLHYVYTLRRWRENFDRHRETVKQMYDERFCRMWEFYLIGAEMDFRHLHTMVFQMQLSKTINAVPITRDYMFKEMSRSENNEKSAQLADSSPATVKTEHQSFSPPVTVNPAIKA